MRRGTALFKASTVHGVPVATPSHALRSIHTVLATSSSLKLVLNATQSHRFVLFNKLVTRAHAKDLQILFIPIRRNGGLLVRTSCNSSAAE